MNLMNLEMSGRIHTDKYNLYCCLSRLLDLKNRVIHAGSSLFSYYIYRDTHKGCGFNDDCKAYIQAYLDKLCVFCNNSLSTFVILLINVYKSYRKLSNKTEFTKILFLSKTHRRAIEDP